MTLPPTLAAAVERSSEVDVEPGPTVSVAVPVEPAAVEVLSGVKVALSCTGDEAAEKVVWHVAYGVSATPLHPEIGMPAL